MEKPISTRPPQNPTPLPVTQVFSVTEKEWVPARPIFWVTATSGTPRIRKVQHLDIYEQSWSRLLSHEDTKGPSGRAGAVLFHDGFLKAQGKREKPHQVTEDQSVMHILAAV